MGEMSSADVVERESTELGEAMESPEERGDGIEGKEEGEARGRDTEIGCEPRRAITEEGIVGEEGEAEEEEEAVGHGTEEEAGRKGDKELEVATPHCELEAGRADDDDNDEPIGRNGEPVGIRAFDNFLG